MQKIRAICFDAFGTLTMQGVQHSPYRQLMALARANGRRPKADDAASIMSMNTGLVGIAKWLELKIDLADLASIECELLAELETIRPYREAPELLTSLKKKGYKLGICSNLAKPYATPVRSQLPDLDVYVWSFQAGAIKPNPRIYKYVVDAFACQPDEVLFIGDTWSADVEGPRHFGMHSLHLARNGQSPDPNYLPQLDALPERLGFSI